MASKSEHFRATAAELEAKAEGTKDLEAKQLFREAARLWREMAERAERQGG